MSEHRGGVVVARRELRDEVEAFLVLEARLADESRYAEWLEQMADDVSYWVPSGPAGTAGRDDRMSYVNDNRRRLETRVGQLLTGVHYAQTPPSPMRRVIANLEFLAVDEVEGEVTTAYNFVLHELSVQATGELRTWAGRATHRLRRIDGGWRIAAKTVELVNASQPLPTLAFLL